MTGVLAIDLSDWSSTPTGAMLNRAVTTVEAGNVLLLPRLGFDGRPDERALFSPSIVKGKNVSFDPSSGRVGGAQVTRDGAVTLRSMLERFSDRIASLVGALFPDYGASLQRGRASFRPVEVAGRAMSWRQDDSRLHIDSFPATPVAGRRILRVFTNVNPNGRPRSWRVGEDFERVARRFAPALRLPKPGTAAILRLLRVTKTRRSAYDALMLQLHDAMKADTAYQGQAPYTAVDFPAGSTWIAFTDQVSHAAMAGQYQLEQTFLLPVDAMREPHRSPLRILERFKGRKLV